MATLGGTPEERALSDELVTIASFATAVEGELLRGFLRAQGIDAVVQGALFATAEGLPAPKWAGVQVQVFAPDAAVAARLVAEHDALRAARRGRPQDDACLACGAPLQPRDLRCAACGWTWIDERAS